MRHIDRIWEGWLRHQRVVLTFRRTLTGWCGESRGAFCNSAEGSAKSCIWRGTNPCTNTCWYPTGWMAALQERT